MIVLAEKYLTNLPTVLEIFIKVKNNYFDFKPICWLVSDKSLFLFIQILHRLGGYGAQGGSGGQGSSGGRGGSGGSGGQKSEILFSFYLPI